MKVAIGADHAGVELKNALGRFLAEEGHEVEDLGTHDHSSVDYPDYAAAVARAVTEGRADRGVLVCGTGIGMAMAANKIPGIRAANCNDLYMVGLAREHNDANVLTIGARVVAPAHAEAVVRGFLETDFDGGRHRRRLDLIEELESS